MMDILKQAAISFKNLEKTTYRIVLSAGRNKPIEEVLLNFQDEDLFHILGLQHLTDIDIPKSKRNLLFLILSEKITDEYLEQSEYYDQQKGSNIKQRIEMASHIEEYLDSDIFTVSIFKLQHDNYTLIKADYLISCQLSDSEKEYYIFIRKRTKENYYGIVSCFVRNNVSYWGGKRYLMLKEKITANNKKILFKHPNYQMLDGTL